jgi:acetyl esterase/lipase
MAHQYALDAARLLERCRNGLEEVLGEASVVRDDQDEDDERGLRRRPRLPTHSSLLRGSPLLSLSKALEETDSLLLEMFLTLLEQEREACLSSKRIQQLCALSSTATLASTADLLVSILQIKKKEEATSNDPDAAWQSSQNGNSSSGNSKHCFYPERSASDSLLFRLIVALQLCLIRIDDAHYVVTGRRPSRQRQGRGGSAGAARAGAGICSPRAAMVAAGAAACSLGLFAGSLRDPRPSGRWLPRGPFLFLRLSAGAGAPAPGESSPLALGAARVGLAYVAFSVARGLWNDVWMRHQLKKSTEAVSEWNRQWRMVQSTTSSWSDLPNAAELSPAALLQAKQTQKLIEYALRQPPKVRYALYVLAHHATLCSNTCFSAHYSLSPQSFLWQSQGELRFLLLKRAMDVLYASVGAAMDVTKKGAVAAQQAAAGAASEHPDWQLTLAAAAASSFYSLIGASRKAAEVTSSSVSARALIQNAWGMVSLPAVKALSLRASRLLKGAAVAERIEICGVPCFVLSADPAPELAAATARGVAHRGERRGSLAALSTIDEQSEHHEEPRRRRRTSVSKPFAAPDRASGYRQRDVIVHLTGGGFFAHIIASDLPYLLDWSASTGAVVICPEYGLLPDHCFPDALLQVEDVYRSLVGGDAASLLGFDANRVIVTGESAGGNLAAALCVKLGLEDGAGDPRTATRVGSAANPNGASCRVLNGSGSLRHIERGREGNGGGPCRLPDALMLSCPVLNLSLELSHSRVVGTADPVLPSGLLSAISDAYVPARLKVSKRDPLASPFFATDAALSKFPPTLLIASSCDPLLDDSVAFNQRLRRLGIESDLRAAENLPHAFLGLGTAGFPEAGEVQGACQAWLGHQLSRRRDAPPAPGGGASAEAEPLNRYP